jgi:hypothetical protein
MEGLTYYGYGDLYLELLRNATEDLNLPKGDTTAHPRIVQIAGANELDKMNMYLTRDGRDFTTTPSTE